MDQVKAKKRRDIDALPLTDKNSEELLMWRDLSLTWEYPPSVNGAQGTSNHSLCLWSPSTGTSCTSLSVALGEFPECSVLQFLFFLPFKNVDFNKCNQISMWRS